MGKGGGAFLSIRLASNEKIAETSSKGNQEKWLEREENRWYKLDQFGYEGLAETMVSLLLAESNIIRDTAFSFVRYRMERVNVHSRERVGCSSENFLRPGQSLITLNKLLSSYLGEPVGHKLATLPSDRQRIKYIAETTAGYTGLVEFPQYLTLLFEIDALIYNDDRHLNNIAVIEEAGNYSYCPIFDNGAGMLSNTTVCRTDVLPKALISSLRSSPFDMTFIRQRNTARRLYGNQLVAPRWSKADIYDIVRPLLLYYPERDRATIAERVVACIVEGQKR